MKNSQVSITDLFPVSSTVNPIKLETGLRPNSARIPYTLLSSIEALGFPTVRLLLYTILHPCSPLHPQVWAPLLSGAALAIAPLSSGGRISMSKTTLTRVGPIQDNSAVVCSRHPHSHTHKQETQVAGHLDMHILSLDSFGAACEGEAAYMHAFWRVFCKASSRDRLRLCRHRHVISISQPMPKVFRHSIKA